MTLGLDTYLYLSFLSKYIGTLDRYLSNVKFDCTSIVSIQEKVIELRYCYIAIKMLYNRQKVSEL